ncbi:hypothetical protein BKA69DRAFT_1102229 [Paraphysoderma sedebokerense]|nr:hypothetical protein BKA69DRAFT_1102229 [Paraphysoderma sedebokerense]
MYTIFLAIICIFFASAQSQTTCGSYNCSQVITNSIPCGLDRVNISDCNLTYFKIAEPRNVSFTNVSVIPRLAVEVEVLNADGDFENCTNGNLLIDTSNLNKTTLSACTITAAKSTLRDVSLKATQIQVNYSYLADCSVGFSHRNYSSLYLHALSISDSEVRNIQSFWVSGRDSIHVWNTVMNATEIRFNYIWPVLYDKFSSNQIGASITLRNTTLTSQSGVYLSCFNEILLHNVSSSRVIHIDGIATCGNISIISTNNSLSSVVLPVKFSCQGNSWSCGCGQNVFIHSSFGSKSLISACQITIKQSHFLDARIVSNDVTIDSSSFDYIAFNCGEESRSYYYDDLTLSTDVTTGSSCVGQVDLGSNVNLYTQLNRMRISNSNLKSNTTMNINPWSVLNIQNSRLVAPNLILQQWDYGSLTLINIIIESNEPVMIHCRGHLTIRNISSSQPIRIIARSGCNTISITETNGAFGTIEDYSFSGISSCHLENTEFLISFSTSTKLIGRCWSEKQLPILYAFIAEIVAYALFLIISIVLVLTKVFWKKEMEILSLISLLASISSFYSLIFNVGKWIAKVSEGNVGIALTSVAFVWLAFFLISQLALAFMIRKHYSTILGIPNNAIMLILLFLNPGNYSAYHNSIFRNGPATREAIDARLAGLLSYLKFTRSFLQDVLFTVAILGLQGSTGLIATIKLLLTVTLFTIFSIRSSKFSILYILALVGILLTITVAASPKTGSWWTPGSVIMFTSISTITTHIFITLGLIASFVPNDPDPPTREGFNFKKVFVISCKYFILYGVGTFGGWMTFAFQRLLWERGSMTNPLVATEYQISVLLGYAGVIMLLQLLWTRKAVNAMRLLNYFY